MHQRITVLVFSVTVTLFATANSHAAMCSDWVDCDLALPVNTTPIAEYSTYINDAESSHFVYFRDAASTYVPNFDAALYQEAQDQFECGYRYLVCELGLDASSILEKVQVYLVDLGNTGGSKGYMTMADYYISYDPTELQHITEGKTARRTTVPIHEFFHIVHYNNFTTSSYEHFMEGLAVLAEQVVATVNYEQSLVHANQLKSYWAPED